MSEQTVSCTNGVEIYVPLLHEGTDVCRPTTGLPLGEMRYQVLSAPGYNPDTEEWEFPPGSVVECKIEKQGAREVLVARKKVTEPVHR